LGVVHEIIRVLLSQATSRQPAVKANPINSRQRNGVNGKRRRVVHTFIRVSVCNAITNDQGRYWNRRFWIANQAIILEKSTLNRIFTLRGKKQEAYKESQKRLFNFPLTVGTSWKDKYITQLRAEDLWLSKGAVLFSLGGDETIVFENYKVLGWEEVEVEAGKFKAIKMEYKREWDSSPGGMREGKAWYWYSPEVKNMVKVQYEKNEMWSKETDW
jgi:hypothetical protein